MSDDGAAYEIAVQQDRGGSGGSTAVHRDFQLGTRLCCGLPGNNFALHEDPRPAILIAGGIGITPIRAMAHALMQQNRQFCLHYAARSQADAAFVNELRGQLGAHLRFYASDQNEKLDPVALVKSASPDSVFYLCGPARLMHAVREAAVAGGIASDRVRFEQFSPGLRTDGAPVRVKLLRSNMIIDVSAHQSILDAVRRAGVETAASCRVGSCGTCAVKVIEGTPEHRDQALTVEERSQAGLMCICVSRATTPELVLDL